MADDDPDPLESREAPADFGEASGGFDMPEADEPAWDDNDERRRKDPFAPPAEPCECYCLHCNRVFLSNEIWFQKVIGDKLGFEGFWMCPTPNCSGAGFTFDIFPTDPNHPANGGWSDDDDDEEEYFDEFDDIPINAEEEPAEWDPNEPMYQAMEAQDDDIEGEEWKFGVEPGDPRPDREPSQPTNELDDEERRYNEPDERPRELDWSNREDRDRPSEDDIPF